MPHSANICVEIIRTLLGKVFDTGDLEKSLTVLAYKKGLPDDPANFRPITLEPVIAKALTSLIRNRIYAFLCKNQYIETNIRKGFWTGISGTIEHIELMSHLINHARQKQRSLIVTLIDLKNAFGEVHHELIRAVFPFSSYTKIHYIYIIYYYIYYIYYYIYIIYTLYISSYYTFTMVFIFQLQRMVFLRTYPSRKRSSTRRLPFTIDLQHVCQHSNNND